MSIRTVSNKVCGQSVINRVNKANRGKSSFISILKSSLQKNIRRCRPDAAVRVAFKLIKLEYVRVKGPQVIHADSFSQFVRRLGIIILEDAVLHPALPAVVWMMVTSTHGYSIPIEAINLLLQVTWEIAAIPYRDPLPDLSMRFKVIIV